jgi:hypothetical protein
MKYLSLKKYCCAYLIIILFLDSTILFANKAICEKAIIQYVDLDVLTIADVSCLNFNLTFDKEIQTYTITNNRKIVQLIALLNDLEIDQETKSLDVRIKITLLYDKKTEEICLDKFNVFRGKCFYKMNSNLLLFIKKQIYP